jgi:hypothetical protein
MCRREGGYYLVEPISETFVHKGIIKVKIEIESQIELLKFSFYISSMFYNSRVFALYF